MNSVTLKTGHRRLAVALALVGVAMLVFASAAAAQDSPSTYPPPPPSPLAPPDWDFDEEPQRPYVGDADLDGDVGIGDAMYIKQYLASARQFSPQQLAVARTTAEDVGIGDAMRIKRYLASVGTLWDWSIDAHHSLRDPMGQNAG